MDQSSPLNKRQAASVAEVSDSVESAPPVDPSQICFAEDCEEIRVRNQKWCTKHKRAAAAMMAQAKREGQQAEVQEIMACDSRCKLAMRDWCEANPVDSKWARKKVLDFTQYQQSHGKLDYVGSLDGKVPKTEAEFLHWATDKKRLTRSGAAVWWKELCETCKSDMILGSSTYNISWFVEFLRSGSSVYFPTRANAC